MSVSGLLTLAEKPCNRKAFYASSLCKMSGAIRLYSFVKIIFYSLGRRKEHSSMVTSYYWLCSAGEFDICVKMLELNRTWHGGKEMIYLLQPV
ncbi:unnamed protein product [Citrullus colocynthis]|uniref:Uncharacterized protein n=1 Tax=Citrullus colocynthis TaxID=252529 RepID=A0ABP0Y9Y1_9ROSI